MSQPINLKKLPQFEAAFFLPYKMIFIKSNFIK